LGEDSWRAHEGHVGPMALPLHVLHDVDTLPLVRGDDPDLLGLDTGTQELGHDLLHCRRLAPVDAKKGHIGTVIFSTQVDK
jgi:hypothetical protein